MSSTPGFVARKSFSRPEISISEIPKSSEFYLR